MGAYKPLFIKGYETGLVQSRENFILPDDAYPTLENAYVWRERIKRKQGFQLLGRLQRNVGTTNGAGGFAAIIGVAPITPGISTFTVGAVNFTDSDPAGVGVVNLLTNGSGTATLNLATGLLTIVGSLANTAIQYFPGEPVMGLRSRELNAINNEELIAFDQNFAYRFVSNAWQEFIAGTTWTGNDSDFFWSTNYFVGDGNLKIFWVTNFSSSDPIRYTNGTAWINFAPQINAAADRLYKCLCMLPFRGRLLAFNTFEGASLGGSVQQFQRIRWSAIGTPFSDVSAIVTTVNANAWRDDIRGQGGFLDIPTSESIVSVGFVRDNLVIYCESSTWQLRYTGRSIAPFQIEKVNSELGAESTFSAVQFDTSLVGVGDKGIVECDSYKSDRIDIKIPDLVYDFNNDNNGTKRVHGIRNFQKRLAFWIYPLASNNGTYPDRRLVYNYENDSWGIYTDSLTCFGTYQKQTSKKWQDFAALIDSNTWQAQNYSWVDRPALFPSVVAGNQQGYVEILDVAATNDISLFIENIIGFGITANDPPIVITSKRHNLQTGAIIKITDLPVTDPYAAVLNGNVYQITRGDNAYASPNDKFSIRSYDPLTGKFSTPALAVASTYQGFGQIAVRDNFSVISKKFNFLDDGQNIQMGYLDVLLADTDLGAISLYVYLDYNNDSPVNTFPQNELVDGNSQPDTFFNTVVPTTTISGLNGSKNWQRVFCPVRGAFITLEWTLSNAQMIGDEQESDVEIDSQILWIRKAGRNLPAGI